MKRAEPQKEVEVARVSKGLISQYQSKSIN